jgi:hypothetical protein
MHVTTTTQTRKDGSKSVTARSGNRRKTVDWTPGIPGGEGPNHGIAARALVEKIVPGYRRVEILNSAKVVSFTKGKTVWSYKD